MGAFKEGGDDRTSDLGLESRPASDAALFAGVAPTTKLRWERNEDGLILPRLDDLGRRHEFARKDSREYFQRLDEKTRTVQNSGRTVNPESPYPEFAVREIEFAGGGANLVVW